MVALVNSYVPSRGDIVYLDFDPTKGHEQRGHRPAFVISPQVYNEKTSLALFMPITKQQKGYPFEVILPSGLKTHGVILTDQMKCLDWKARGVQFVESVAPEVTEEVQARISPLLW
ncbi:endoribonuclease MazF [Nodularia sp. NIES-3585]|uniref:endoribonuclease MazF n=1 Tax=Nodularia sp. NIES-3585 TaxID=1973477 RepID=UPI000B5CA006|nr:endoribonuclease MazF [Nodularia sp. NIES-3585]GAX36229.1 transcriptional modulator of MazE/toxin MazF [Nodularia sp. NIES-3585]